MNYETVPRDINKMNSLPVKRAVVYDPYSECMITLVRGICVNIEVEMRR